MKSIFTKSWSRSVQPRRQRKYRYNAPYHRLQKFMRAHLSKELRKKYGIKTFGMKKGDTVKVMRGQFKGKTGKINSVDLGRTRVYIEGIESVKKEGAKSFIPVDPTNIMIIDLDLNDKKRKQKLASKTVAEVVEKPKTAKKEGEQNDKTTS